MEHVVARLLRDYEDGRMTRRHLIQRLAVAAVAASTTSAAAQSARKGFRTVSINHISYQVADYAPQETKPPRVDHIAFNIENWDTDLVKAELHRRGLTPRLDAAVIANRASFHVADPDGYDLQIEGTLKRGDSLLTK
jgi:hypothetical protein